MSIRLVLGILILALLPCARGADLAASIARDSINVGETTVVTFSGGQLDVAGGNIIDNIGTEFAHAVEIKRIDRNHFQVKGLAAGDLVLKFSDGQNKVAVNLHVLKK